MWLMAHFVPVSCRSHPCLHHSFPWVLAPSFTENTSLVPYVQTEVLLSGSRPGFRGVFSPEQGRSRDGGEAPILS